MVDYSLAIHIHLNLAIPHTHTFAWLSHRHVSLAFKYTSLLDYTKQFYLTLPYTPVPGCHAHPHLSDPHLVAWIVNTTWRCCTSDFALAQSLWLLFTIRSTRSLYRGVQVSLKSYQAHCPNNVSMFWCCMRVAHHVKYSAVFSRCCDIIFSNHPVESWCCFTNITAADDHLDITEVHIIYNIAKCHWKNKESAKQWTTLMPALNLSVTT